MASGEHSPSKGQEISSSSSSNKNEDDNPWLLPNNLELNSRLNPSKKQRNKESVKNIPPENLTGFARSTNFQNFSKMKYNTAWIKDQLNACDERLRKRTPGEEEFRDNDYRRGYGINFPTHPIELSEEGAENVSANTMKDEIFIENDYFSRGFGAQPSDYSEEAAENVNTKVVKEEEAFDSDSQDFQRHYDYMSFPDQPLENFEEAEENVFSDNDYFSRQEYGTSFPDHTIQHSEETLKPPSIQSNDENIFARLRKIECNKNRLNPQSLQETNQRKKLSGCPKPKPGFTDKYQEDLNRGTKASSSHKIEASQHDERLNHSTIRSNTSHCLESFEDQIQYQAEKLHSDSSELRNPNYYFMHLDAQKQKLMKQCPTKRNKPFREEAKYVVDHFKEMIASLNTVNTDIDVHVDGNAEGQSGKSNHIIEKKKPENRKLKSSDGKVIIDGVLVSTGDEKGKTARVKVTFPRDHTDGSRAQVVASKYNSLEKKPPEASSGVGDLDIFGAEQQTTFELERKKLKNKLMKKVELDEKKMMNNDLVQSHLEDSSNLDSGVADDSALMPCRRSQLSILAEGKHVTKKRKMHGSAPPNIYAGPFRNVHPGPFRYVLSDPSTNVRAEPLTNGLADSTTNVPAGLFSNLRAGSSTNVHVLPSTNMRVVPSANVLSCPTNAKTGPSTNVRGPATHLRAGPSTDVRAGPSTNMRGDFSTNMRARPSSNMHTSPSTNVRAGLSANACAVTSTNDGPFKNVHTGSTNVHAGHSANVHVDPSENVRFEPFTNVRTSPTNVHAVSSTNLRAGSSTNVYGGSTNARGGSTKRDNVRKENDAAFPARRHYEAEGRANEDPVAPAPGSPKPYKILLNPEAARIYRKIQRGMEDVDTLNKISQFCAEYKKKGMWFPVDQLYEYFERVTSFAYEESGEESENDYTPMVVTDHLEEVPTDEEDNDSDVSAIFEDTPDGLIEDLDMALRQCKLLIRRHLFEIERLSSTNENHNENRASSNGEGVQGRENLQLTRQNVAKIESHNRALDRNLHKEECRSNKKVNKVCDKMGRLQTAAQSSFSKPDCPRENLDSTSILSHDLNQSHCSETENKTIIDILKHVKKTEKRFERNQAFRIHKSPSITSGPFENPNSALATDTGIAATWGGSSSQCFDEGNEESFQEQNRNYPNFQRTYRESKPKVIANTETASKPLYNFDRQNCREPRQPDLTSPHFDQELKRQVDKLVELCAGSLSRNLSAHEEFTNLHQGSNPNFISSCSSVPPMSVTCNPYNQQLLICLIQCYHTLYLQQLEIRQLQHTIQNSFGAEIYHQANGMSVPEGSNEVIGIRPYNLATWPMNTQTFPPVPLSPTSLYPQYENEHLKYYPPLRAEFGTGVPTVRYSTLRNPSKTEESRASEETLNNQVPPRTTRANNFLDNFRSYSRLNLLSASTNVKRNENAVSQQVQLVHPSVLNESSHYNQDENTYGSVAELERPTHESESPLLNADLHAYRNHSKKANATASASANNRDRENHKKSFLFNINPDARNILPDTYNGQIMTDRYNGQNREASVQPITHSSSVNLIQLHSSHEESKLGSFSSIFPTSAPEPAASTPAVTEEPTSEVLLNLYKEAKSLTEHHNALKFIRDMVLSDKSDSEFPSQNKVRNDSVASSTNPDNTPEGACGPTIDNVQVDSTNFSDTANAEMITTQTSIDNVSWATMVTQNLPTAAVSPLNKPVSTGAVRKIPKVFSTFGEAHIIQQSSNEAMAKEIASDESNTSASNANYTNDAGYPKNMVRRILLELRQYIISLCFASRDVRSRSSPSFWGCLNLFVVSRIETNRCEKMSSKLISAIHHALDQFTAGFCGLPVSDCETKYLEFVSQLICESISPGAIPICLTPPGEEELAMWQIKGLDALNMEESEDGVPERVFPSEVKNCPVLSQTASLEGSEKDGNDVHSTCLTSALGDVRSICGIEAETEPEVEAGTEADLAEADQSPGQQGNVTINSSTAIITVDPTWPLNAVSLGAIDSTNGATGYENATDVSHSAYFCSEASNGQDICLDDIPTKLCSHSDNERGEEEQLACITSSNDPKDETSPTTDICDHD